MTSVDSVFKCVYFFLALCVLASEFLFFSNFEDVAVSMSQSLTLDLMIFAGWAVVAALVIKKRPAFLGAPRCTHLGRRSVKGAGIVL